MTILSVVRDVCATVGVTLPQALFSGVTDNRTAQEMLALANEMAQRIAYDNRDWTALRATAVVLGDGMNWQFNLPANYKRLLLTTNVRRQIVTNPEGSPPGYHLTTTAIHPMRFIADLDEWMQRRAEDVVEPNGEWTMYAGKISIWPIMPPNTNAHFTYMDRNCINLTSGGRGDSFMADTDSFTLDERLLKLAMIWQWKAQKGAPYAEDMGTYGDALTMAMGHDAPAPIIIGRRPISASARTAIPTQTIVVPGMVP